LFLQERFFGLVSAIEEDKRLTSEDKDQLFFIKLILDRDGTLQQNSSPAGLQPQSIDLTNSSLFGPQGIQNPVMSEYMDALRGAYAMFLASTPEALEDIPEEFRNSIKQSLELKNCLALSWTIQTQSHNQ
jgi:hypothetical protein